MEREIGGFIEENSAELKTKNHHTFSSMIKGRTYYFATARSALMSIIRSIDIKNKKCIIPDFLCQSIINVFINEGWEVCFYGIDSSFNIDVEEVSSILETINPDVIIFISYFGKRIHNTVREVLDDYKKTNSIIVIGDMTQSVELLNTDNWFDYKIASVRKWLGILDGGIVVTQNRLNGPKTIEEDDVYINNKRSALLLKKRYLSGEHIEKQVFLDKNEEAEKRLDEDMFIRKMTTETKMKLASVDFVDVLDKRKRNITFLKKNLRIQCFLNNEYTSVPLYFPIYVDKKYEFQKELIDEKIYLANLWPKPKQLIKKNDKCEELYSHMLCVPCDQRYSLDDMAWVCEKMNDIGRKYE